MLFFHSFGEKKDRVNRKCLIGPLEKGGLNMIDIEAKFDAIKAVWLKRFINASLQSDVPSWSVIRNY